MFVRCLAASLVLAGAAFSVQAQSPLTADQSRQLDAYMKQRGPAHVASAPPAAPVTPDMAPGNGLATVNRPEQPDDRLASSLLALDAPPSVSAGLTYGMAAGLGAQPALPQRVAWEQEAAQAIVAAFEKPAGETAEQRALFAATPSGDPAFDERMALVRTLYTVDGTDALIRHFVSKEHMKLIIQEVSRHIDFAKLKESDRYRLAAIAAVVQTELEDSVITLAAQGHASSLSKPELMQLVAAYNIDAQRKLTQLRLNDDGKIDRAAELDLRLAQFQIVKQFESGQ